jgi:dTMP kinase
MFVVFEGIDGSGKTTLSNRVAAELAAQGITVKHLRAEGKLVSPVAEGIREFARSAQNLTITWQTEFLLYVARDVQLIHEALRPALATHDLVLADRFLYTPEVLGRYVRKLPETFTRPVLEAAADGLQPDLVILIDVDPTLARARRKLRKLEQAQAKPPARKGLAGAGLQQRLRQGYLALAAEQPERWAVLENRGSIEQAVERAVALIREAQQGGAAPAIQRFRQRAASGPPAPSRSTAVRPAPTDPSQALAAFLTLIDELIEREPRVAAYLLGGMHGRGVDERRRSLLERATPALLAALDSLADDESFRLRRLAADQYPAAVLRSLGQALLSPRGWALWHELAARAPLEALACLGGVDDERAWQLRVSSFDPTSRAGEQVVATLGGLDDEQAWQLRERLLSHRSASLETDYELARVLAKSVTSLGSERAWSLRRASRQLAPVAALSSLFGLSDTESWQWRSEALLQAPKVVMGTLRGLTEARAWELRRAVAQDCKEALDGLQGVDAEEAWALRQATRDVWPSTVVKSLGALADQPRGQELLGRQLAQYPDNVSLLKHASSIALGLHRSPRGPVE